MANNTLVISDMHIDTTDLPDSVRIEEMLSNNPKYILIAGDLGNGSDLVSRFFKKALPVWKDQIVCYVAGNHDYYGCDFARFPRVMEELEAQFPNFHFLNGSSNFLVLPDAKEPTVIIGNTLWTDMELYVQDGSLQTLDDWGFRAIQYMNDFRYIMDNGKKFYAKGWMAKHQLDIANMRAAFAQFVGTHKIVAMTHHLPHARSLDPIYVRYVLDHCYVSNILGRDELLSKAAVWIHGHSHSRANYMEGNTRVLANPVGYCEHREEHLKLNLEL